MDGRHNLTMGAIKTRGPRAGRVLVVLLIVLGVLGIAGLGIRAVNQRFERGEQNRAARETLEAANQKMKSELRDKVANGGLKASDVSIGEGRASLNKAIAESTGEQRMILECTARGQETALMLMEEYQKKVTELAQTGGLKPQSLQSESDIDTRLKAIAALQVLNDKLDAAMTAVPTNVEQELRNKGLSAQKVRDVSVGVLQALKLEQQKRVRQTDRTLYEAATKMLTLLKDRFGSWHLDADTKLVFKSNNDAKEYNEHLKQVQKAVEEQRNAQRDALSK